MNRFGQRLTFRASVLPKAARRLLPANGSSRRPAGIAGAWPTQATVSSRALRCDLTLDRRRPMLSGHCSKPRGEAQGNVVVTRCPPAWKKDLPIWGQPPRRHRR